MNASMRLLKSKSHHHLASSAVSMAAKTKVKGDKNHKTVRVGKDNIFAITKDMPRSQMLAVCATTPSVNGSATLQDFSGLSDKIDLNALIDEVTKAGKEVVDGDLSRLEKVLTCQALTLDSIFNDLARRAKNAEYLDNFNTYMKLAFKAQSQSRTTVEAIAAVKRPTTFIKQQNIAQGHQQINNHQVSEKKSEDVPSKLVEATHGERLEFGTQTATGCIDSAVETLG